MTDHLFYPDTLEIQQWLVYYISKPLFGSYENTKIPRPVISSEEKLSKANGEVTSPDSNGAPSRSSEQKVVKGFNDVLGQFPLIARQMQHGLERILQEARQDMKRSPQSQTTRRLSDGSTGSVSSSKTRVSIKRRLSDGHSKASTAGAHRLDEEEEYMQSKLETAVTNTIDLFQQVDKQQLSVLGTTTNLTGPAVELLIERYVTEQLHDTILFPFICKKMEFEDQTLNSRVNGMQHIDLAQVGIPLGEGKSGKMLLMRRIAKGIEEFRKLGVAGSPQQMIEVLLKTQKGITSSSVSMEDGTKSTPGDEKPENNEDESILTTNADTLVSLLLMVVIRSQIRHLRARLCYMQNFVFIDDVEAGEIGYALSTFEAVLAYLSVDSGGLRRASKKNKEVWQAVREGELEKLKALLDPTGSLIDFDNDEEGNGDMDMTLTSTSSPDEYDRVHASNYCANHDLTHVFPFQAQPTNRQKKRVSLDMRSISNSSEHSFRSRSTTLDSWTSAIEGDTSVITLAQSQDSEGRSLLMMAIEARHIRTLEYLLSRHDLYPLQSLLKDVNRENTTLLSASVQSGNIDVIEALFGRILEIGHTSDILQYFSSADDRGRTAAHYLFNAPQMIPRFMDFIPWTKKDKNGQTPLFALCRSYDHPEYTIMINQALQYATQAQGDGKLLHLDDHVDVKGNTLLHVINDSTTALRILQYCDSDANAMNDKQFTPLMMASKYGRMDMVRALFADQRTDLLAKEQRGMTAVELAKDDEIRNRMDDMVLVSNAPAPNGRVTAVVRSFLVDDASLRMIIKSAVHNDNGMIAVTTCRRSLTDFENLAQWLAAEQPASWLPSIFSFRSPFQIPSRPSRAVLQNIQFRLDRFLKIMIAHTSFSSHELLWEFVLFPEIQLEMMAERSKRKADTRIENVRDDFEPATDVREVSSFVEHARESVRSVSHSARSVTRRIASVRLGFSSKLEEVNWTRLQLIFSRCCYRFSNLRTRIFRNRASAGVVRKSSHALQCLPRTLLLGSSQNVTSGFPGHSYHNPSYAIFTSTPPFIDKRSLQPTEKRRSASFVTEKDRSVATGDVR